VPPAGLYESALAHAGIVYTAGMTPREDGWILFPGRVGADVDPAEARVAARIAALRALSAAAQAAGGVERIVRLLRLTVYVASADGFTGHTAVGDGATEALIEALGERGRVARTACGVASLPGNACVEVELTAAYREAPRGERLESP
jgi:enamine deaminase RidA (YjgF/YER057c/UK114 family)